MSQPQFPEVSTQTTASRSEPTNQVDTRGNSPVSTTAPASQVVPAARCAVRPDPDADDRPHGGLRLLMDQLPTGNGVPCPAHRNPAARVDSLPAPRFLRPRGASKPVLPACPLGAVHGYRIRPGAHTHALCPRQCVLGHLVRLRQYADRATALALVFAAGRHLPCISSRGTCSRSAITSSSGGRRC
jgi:hypothetical protein